MSRVRSGAGFGLRAALLVLDHCDTLWAGLRSGYTLPRRSRSPGLVSAATYRDEAHRFTGIAPPSVLEMSTRALSGLARWRTAVRV